jgi:hypothetical protein
MGILVVASHVEMVLLHQPPHRRRHHVLHLSVLSDAKGRQNQSRGAPEGEATKFRSAGAVVGVCRGVVFLHGDTVGGSCLLVALERRHRSAGGLRLTFHRLRGERMAPRRSLASRASAPTAKIDCCKRSIHSLVSLHAPQIA